MSRAEVLARVDESELVSLAQDLIRIPSVVRPGDPTMTEAAVAAYIQRWFEKEGLAVEIQDVAPGRPNVLGSLGEPADGPTLLLEGHTDVVTEGDPRAWTFPPFSGALDGGRIHGRGAADMIRRIYFRTSKRTIRQDLERALDLLKSMTSEEERERATVYMHGLAEMNKDWFKKAKRGKKSR